MRFRVVLFRSRLAARTGLSKSEIVAAAIGSYLSPDGGDKREAALAARLDRLGRQYERIERDQTILIETVALFVRHTLTVTAPIPAAHQEAAVAQGRERFRQFVEQLARRLQQDRSEEHTSELQSLMRISYAVFCLKKKNTIHHNKTSTLNINQHTHT